TLRSAVTKRCRATALQGGNFPLTIRLRYCQKNLTNRAKVVSRVRNDCQGDADFVITPAIYLPQVVCDCRIRPFQTFPETIPIASIDRFDAPAFVPVNLIACPEQEFVMHVDVETDVFGMRGDGRTTNPGLVRSRLR